MAKVLASGLSRHLLPMNEIRQTQLNVPSPQQLALPFYNSLPKDPIELLKWKLYVRKRCLKDLEFRDAIEAMCSQDIAFWAATYGCVFEPRPPRAIPLTPWMDQVDCLIWMKECLDTERDCGIEKTRGMYMSWTAALFAYWVMRYMPEAKIAYVTKDENSMDGPDANSFIGKIMYLHERMPAWVRLGRNGKSTIHRTMDQHLLIFKPNAASLQGFPPTNQNVRSLRFTVLINDEFAFFPRDAAQALVSAAFTTNCRIFISTWYGCDNQFHTIMRVQKSTMLRIEAYWWNNFERWQGAYTSENGRLKIVDKGFDWAGNYPNGYPYVLDGMLRSPWVDYEFRKPGADPQKTREELYGLQAEGGRKLFKAATIRVIEPLIAPPMYVGEMDLHGRDPVFKQTHNGLLKMWADLGGGKGGPFAAGCDLGFGRGASHSTLELIDLSTARHVLDYADNTLNPTDFAYLVVNTLRWVNGPKGDGHTHLDFEANGDQATQFDAELLRLAYGHVRERKLRRKVQDSPRTTYRGTHSGDGGAALFGDLERAILAGELLIFSDMIWEEMKHFDEDDKGRPVFPQSAGIGHGDRIQGLAIAWAYARDRLIEVPMTPEAHAAMDMERIRTPHTRDWSAGWRMRRSA